MLSLIEIARLYIRTRLAEKEMKNNLDIAKEQLLSHPDFHESINIDGHVLAIRQAETMKLKEKAEVPEEYVTSVFDYAAMIKKEPKQRERLVKWFAEQYPEYVVKKIDEAKLSEDHPEMFDKTSTKTVVFTEAKQPAIKPNEATIIGTELPF